MAELRESFPVLENTGTGAGEAIAAKQVGAAPGAHNGIMGFAFRDSSGNLVLPQLNSEGRLPVTLEGAGVELGASGALAAGSATMVDITGATVTLVAGTVYTQIRANVSCFRDSLFHVVWMDDATPTIIGKIRVGAGQYNFEWTAGKRYVTAGASGVQTLKIMGQNVNSLSEMSAELSCVSAAV